MNTSVVATVLSYVAFALAITATFAPAWVTFQGRYTGFFGTCLQGTCSTTTVILEASDGTKASAAFMIIGTFILLAGSVLMAMKIKEGSKVAGIIIMIGGVATLIGVAVFAGVITLIGTAAFSVSFGFAWVAAFLGIAAGALAIRKAE